VQKRTDVSGKFSFTGLPEGEVTVIVTAHKYRRRQIKLGTLQDDSEDVIIEMRPDRKVPDKVKVKGIAVEIAEEIFLELETTGERLSVSEYVNYAKSELLRHAPDPKTMRKIWGDREKRQKLVEALRGHSIHPEVLATLEKRADLDDFDLLAKVAYGLPMHTRDERANAFKTTSEDFLSAFDPEAREVLLALVDKYRIGGVAELTRPEIFNVPPFDKMGYAPGVVKRFGGPEQFLSAVDELQKRLYETEETA